MISLLLIIASSVPAVAEELESANTPWRPDVRIGLKGGVRFTETAMGGEFEPGGTVGGEIALGFPSHGMHHGVLGAGYLFLGKTKNGTKEIEVETIYHRVDITAGYEFVWRALVAGAKTGLSITPVSTTTKQFELGMPEYEFENDAYYFTNRTLLDSHKEIGANLGFFAGLGVGLNIGYFVRNNARLKWLVMHLVLDGEYLRRGERDDFFCTASVVFFPINFFR
jgi:hypothetical protein